MRLGRALLVAEPAKVAEYVKSLSDRASGEALSQLKKHLSPAVAHFTVCPHTDLGAPAVWPQQSGLLKLCLSMTAGRSAREGQGHLCAHH